VTLRQIKKEIPEARKVLPIQPSESIAIKIICIHAMHSTSTRELPATIRKRSGQAPELLRLTLQDRPPSLLQPVAKWGRRDIDHRIKIWVGKIVATLRGSDQRVDAKLSREILGSYCV